MENCFFFCILFAFLPFPVITSSPVFASDSLLLCKERISLGNHWSPKVKNERTILPPCLQMTLFFYLQNYIFKCTTFIFGFLLENSRSKIATVKFIFCINCVLQVTSSASVGQVYYSRD